MEYTLGLDIGTNSIGWAVVDENKHTIVNCGVRIFPAGKDKLNQGDNEVSRNAARRDNRQKRRSLYRKKLRKVQLLKALIALDMCPLTDEELKSWTHYDKSKGKAGQTFPDTPEFRAWLKLNPYTLRAKAIKQEEEISRQEFGRILYHLIQRRGFLSSRKAKDKDEGTIYKGKDNTVGIEDTRKKLGNSSLGHYLNTLYPPQEQSYQTIQDDDGKLLRIRGRYTLRDMYIHEFKQIWEVQAPKLDLNDVLMTKTKSRFFHGSLNNKRNQKKLQVLKDKYGESQIEIVGKKIISTEQIPLKEYLAGEIIHLEDGKLKHKSAGSVLFYQRPLRSQKGLLGKCTFEGRKFYDKAQKRWIETGPAPALISHPEYEEFRAMQFINNIDYDKKTKLDPVQRAMVMDLFNTKKSNFKFKEIIKALKLDGAIFNYRDDTLVATNYTIANLAPLFPEEVWQTQRHDIWHCVHFYDDNDMLFDKLKKDYALILDDDQESRKKLAQINLKEDYANVSLKAIRNINPFLAKGYQYSLAVLLGGVRNAFRTTDAHHHPIDRWDYFQDRQQEIERAVCAIVKEKNKAGEAIQKIKNYLVKNCGFEPNDKAFQRLYHHSQEVEQKVQKQKIGNIENLRNPVVQQSLNEIKRLVNQLIDVYGQFQRINVELGREVKAGVDKRQEMSRRIRENQEKNEEARQHLTNNGLQHSRDNIHKYLLFKEIKEKYGMVRCPYTNKTITINDLLGEDNKIQIEHIFPRSKTFDNSLANKTLCDAKFNGLKGNLSPYQFYLKNNDPKLWNAKDWKTIETRAYELLPYQKAKRFTSQKREFDEGQFVERQLNDTRYIGVKTKEILSEVCSDVRILSGQLTSELRHLWGMNSILQKSQVVDYGSAQIDEDQPLEHYALLDENDQVLELIPKYNPRPDTSTQNITLAGDVNNKEIFSTKALQGTTLNAPDCAEGKHWLQLQLAKQTPTISPVFAERPDIQEDELVLRAKVANGKFDHANLGRVKTTEDDGTYWGVFKITNIEYLPTEKKKQPKKSRHQLLLYGTVKDSIFSCYLFDKQVYKEDGQYWALVDVDLENAHYQRVANPKPKIGDKQILIQGTVSAEGLFATELDKQFSIQTDMRPGVYYAVLTYNEQSARFFPQEKELLQAEKEQKVIEGLVWVDKKTGEIRFDPKKNREDHRHHAVDALVIAVNKQSYVQQLSTYYANLDERSRNRPHDKPVFPEPWENFRVDAQRAVQQILVSHKINKPERKVLTNIKKTINKNGRKFKSQGKAVRGQLHKESIYGRRQAPHQDKPYYHIRKDVHTLTSAQIKKIVDPTIRRIVERDLKSEKELAKKYKALQNKLNRSKAADQPALEAELREVQQQLDALFKLPNRKGGDPVPIKKVRVRENFSNAQQVKDRSIRKEKSGDQVQVNQHVNPENNHHVALYIDSQGTMSEEVVTFWEAAERKKQGLPVINKTPDKDRQFVVSLQENDMFLIGLPDNAVDFDKPDYSLLNRHLFRLQKISSGDYTFRHHLASTLNNPLEEFRIRSFPAWKKCNPIKVKIDQIGRITPYE